MFAACAASLFSTPEGPGFVRFLKNIREVQKQKNGPEDDSNILFNFLNNMINSIWEN